MNIEKRRSFFRVLAALLAASFIFAPAAAQQAPAQVDRPALWKIAGPKSNVYLFGSFHLLPPDVNWKTAAVESALNEASVVVFETDLVAAQRPQTMQALIANYGVLPPGETLASVLPADTYAAFERSASELLLPPAPLAPFRPWLAALLLSVQFVVSQGLDPSKGVDQQVMAWAQTHGKTLAALESNETQIRVFADLTRAQEIELMAVTLRQIREMPQRLGELLTAYRSGDVAALERTLNQGINEFPVLRQRMINDRHDRWLPQIERMIADGRTHMIVVGAAHLAGPDSVVAMLRRKGFRVEGP
ncbi:MAG TPA: TraB/GumN family protein [Burkholderiales bacterium]|nr:TraB/GumN family protein [Burkholderiales bacterium]